MRAANREHVLPSPGEYLSHDEQSKQKKERNERKKLNCSNTQHTKTSLHSMEFNLTELLWKLDIVVFGIKS